MKYVHTNIIAKDWKKLAQFYIDVFNCTPVLPERNLSGDWVDRLTRLQNAGIRGIHLRLPGFENGPTLEIFEYSPENLKVSPALINRQGFGHIAFQTKNVEKVLNKVMQCGGDKYGEVVKKPIAGIGILTAVYACDPEGNIVEIQHWEKQKL